MNTREQLEASARGDREALALFASLALDAMMTDPLLSETHLSEAATFARLAAMHGEAKDMQILAGVLLVQAHLLKNRAEFALQQRDDSDAGYFIQASTRAKAHAIQWLNTAADAGSDDATSYLLMLADSADNGDAFEMARRAGSAIPNALPVPLESCHAWADAKLSAVARSGAARS